MKKLALLAVIAVMVFASNAYATFPFQGPKGDKGEQGEKGDTGERRSMYGPGADIMCYQTKDKDIGVETQYRYDVNRDAHSIFAVLKVNLWEELHKK